MAAPLGKPQEGCAASFPPLHKKTGEAAATPAFFLFRPISGRVPGLLPLQRPPAAASRQPPPTHSASFAASSIVHSRISPNTFPTKKHLPPRPGERRFFYYFHCQSSKHRRPLRLCPFVLPTVMRPLPRSAITSPSHTSSAARRHSACRRLTSPAAMSAAA